MTVLKPSLPTVRVSIDSVHEDPENARKHPKRNLDSVRRSLVAHGFVAPLVVRRANGRIIGGNATYRMLRDLGETEVDVVFLDIGEDEAKVLAIRLNRTAELAKWDVDRLEVDLAALEAAGVDVAADLDFRLGDLVGLGFDIDPGALDVHDQDTPERPAEPVTRPGDLWTFPTGHRLLCGDATKPDDVARVLAGDRFHVLFTDPPYGVAYDAAATRDTGKEWAPIANDALAGEDLVAFNGAWLDALLPHASSDATLYVCAADTRRYELETALRARGVYQAVPIVWVKDSPVLSWHRYHPQHEPILVAGPGAKPTGSTSRWHGPTNETTVWNVPRDPAVTYQHPTQKPVALPGRAIRNSTRPREIILDVFHGAGATLLACEQLRRQARAIELDPGYCDVAIARYVDLTGQRPVRGNGHEWRRKEAG